MLEKRQVDWGMLFGMGFSAKLIKQRMRGGAQGMWGQPSDSTFQAKQRTKSLRYNISLGYPRVKSAERMSECEQ